MRLKTIRWILWGITGAVSLSLAFAILWRDDRFGTEPSRETDAFRADFELTDHQGMVRTDEDFAGRWLLVFFGFANCPDVCPMTLADISGWLDDLGAEAERMNVVFITVDPERDTVSAMKEYVGYFHPALRGWTGSPDEISRAAEGFRVIYEKVPVEGGYTMNHTAGVFLFNAGGRFVSTIDYHEPREFAVPKIRRTLETDDGGQT